MVIDSISNLINSLKNASVRGLATVSLPHTKMQESVLEVLKKEGFVAGFETKGKEPKQNLEITVKYENGAPAIHGAKRVSKLSRRMYKGVKSIFSVQNGYGISVLSTPKGIMADHQARKENVGGEALFEIW